MSRTISSRTVQRARQATQQRQPGIVARATTAMQRWVSAGRPQVDEQTLQARRDCCNACEKRWRKICRICGCALPLKQQMATEHCPDGLWPSTKMSSSRNSTAGDNDGS